MENFLVCIEAILPMFLIIALGYFLRRINVISEKFALEGNAFAFKVFCRLCYSLTYLQISKTDF